MLPVKERLQEVGKIKIGKKGEAKQSRNNKNFRMPQKLDHFIVTKTVRDSNDDFIEDQKVMQTLGPRPQAIEVILPDNNIEKIWQSERSFYTGSGRSFCRSEDGQVASRAVTKKENVNGTERVAYTGERQTIECTGEDCPFAQKKQCKPYGRLFVMLPQSQQLGGYYVFRTTSWNTITNIQNQIQFLHNVTAGNIAGLRMKLKVSPKTVNYMSADNISKKTTIYEVGLFYEGDVESLYAHAERYAKSRIAGQQKMIDISEARDQVSGALVEDEARKLLSEFNPEVAMQDESELLNEIEEISEEEAERLIRESEGHEDESINPEDIAGIKKGSELRSKPEDGNKQKTLEPSLEIKADGDEVQSISTEEKIEKYHNQKGGKNERQDT